MSMRKLLLTLLLSLSVFCAASSVYAANSQNISSPRDTEHGMGRYFSDTGMYIDMGLGYTASNYSDAPTLVGGGPYTNGHGGFSIGGDLGYQYNEYFAAELGWYNLPSVRYSIFAPGDADLQTYEAYLAGKLMWHWDENPSYELFFKVGASYRYAFADGSGLTHTHGYKWGPMFGLGAEYTFQCNMKLGVQFLHFPGGVWSGNNNNNHFVKGGVPAVNMVLLTAGYMFFI